MTSEPTELWEQALRDVEYLARSANRIRILNALVREPNPPRELVELTGTSQSTLRRILSELEERGWAERTVDGTYAVTPAGEHVVDELAPFIESMETIRNLGDAIAWLPTEELSIGIRHFSDASVRRPEPNDPLAPSAFLTKQLRGTTEFRCLVRLAPPLAFEKEMRDAVCEGRLQTEHVITAGELAYLRDCPERLRRWREYLEAGANVYRYDGEIPCNLLLFDKTVLVGQAAPKSGGCVFIESEDETVRLWAHDIITTYRADAERLHAEAFMANPPV